MLKSILIDVEKLKHDIYEKYKSIKELEEASGVKKGTIDSVLFRRKSRGIIGPTTLYKIAEALHTDADIYILDDQTRKRKETVDVFHNDRRDDQPEVAALLTRYSK